MDLSLEPRHALLLEDDPADQEALSRLLAREGWRIASADSLQAARALLASGYRPTVALIDLHLPPDDAFSLVIDLQNHPTWRNIPLVLVSGRYDAQQGAAFFNTAGWLAKPVTSSALREVLANCMGGQRQGTLTER